MQVPKLKWREKRGDGWSKTRYSGLYFYIDGRHPVLVSRISPQALRVVQKGENSEYRFISPLERVEVSKSFINAAKVALEAGVAITSREQLDEFERAMSPVARV